MSFYYFNISCIFSIPTTTPLSYFILVCYTGFPLFSKYQIPGFLKVFGPKFQPILKFFLCQIPGTFIQNFSYKNLEMC